MFTKECKLKSLLKSLKNRFLYYKKQPVRILFIVLFFTVLTVLSIHFFKLYTKHKSTSFIIDNYYIQAFEEDMCSEEAGNVTFLHYEITLSQDRKALIGKDCLSGVIFSQTLEETSPTQIELDNILYSVSLQGNELTFSEK